jgi:phosphoribosyl-dephospho-CoA transferase
LSPIQARPHDLIRLEDPSALVVSAAPAWVGPSLAGAPWVVVRRCMAPPGFFAVGIRGAARSERCAALIPTLSAASTVKPEDLRPQQGNPIAQTKTQTPAAATLQQACAIMDETALAWGPVGSVGFELATGTPATRSTSDLDLIVRTDEVPACAWASSLVDQLSRLPARVDCQVETKVGAIALSELAANPPTLVLRTRAGPRLVSIEGLRAMIAHLHEHCPRS